MSNSHKLKIGLDYHGVIDNNVIYFSKFCDYAQKNGCKIFIITGGPGILIKDKLKNYNIAYDFVFAISDYYQALNIIIQQDNGSLSIPENMWNSGKADFCYRNKIDIHIDDSTKYFKDFVTPYCYYDKKKNKGLIPPDTNLDFNEAPELVLQKIKSYLTNCKN